MAGSCEASHTHESGRMHVSGCFLSGIDLRWLIVANVWAFAGGGLLCSNWPRLNILFPLRMVHAGFCMGTDQIACFNAIQVIAISLRKCIVLDRLCVGGSCMPLWVCHDVHDIEF